MSAKKTELGEAAGPLTEYALETGVAEELGLVEPEQQADWIGAAINVPFENLTLGRLAAFVKTCYAIGAGDGTKLDSWVPDWQSDHIEGIELIWAIHPKDDLINYDRIEL